MRVESFMQIKAPSHPPDGSSTSDLEFGDIEILSFQHAVERTPTRTQATQYRDLQQNLRDAQLVERAVASDRRMPVGTTRAHGAASRAQQLARELASTLTHPPLSVLKIVDAASPRLCFWATKSDQLLEMVTITLRTLQPKGNKFEVQELLQVKLTDAFICDIAIIGSFPEQPWLTQTSSALWQSAPALNVGPVEQIMIAYQKIEWLVNSKSAFKWDVAEKKTF